MGLCKVLYVHHGGAEGGAPKSLRFLLEKLPKDKFSSAILCITEPKENKRAFGPLTGNFYYEHWIAPFHGSTVCDVRGFFPALVQLMKVPLSVLNAMKYIRKEKPQIVHINSTCLWPAAVAAKLCDRNIKVICHVREPLADSFCGRKIRKMCKKYADGFVAIDAYDLNSPELTDQRYKVIYNFVDFAAYDSALVSDVLRRECGIPQTATVLLFLARLSPFNGALAMIEHMHDFLEERKDVHLCIVGLRETESDYAKRLIAACAKHENAHLLAFKTDVPQMIASSDIMIVPFLKPHFARSIIEAAAMGVPSLASDMGGLSELIVPGSTGMLFNGETFADFIPKLRKMVDDSEFRRRLGQNAERYAKENFSASINAKATFDFYEQVYGKELAKSKKSAERKALH